VGKVLALCCLEQLLQSKPVGRVAVLLGSASDAEFGNKIRSKLGEFDIDCELRVTSAHKGPDTTLKILAEYEGMCFCIVCIICFSQGMRGYENSIKCLV
jgi:phosphoribosylcarboxyaminoimidazole (NCAIR) mutase